MNQNINNLMKEAQKMQERMQQAQQELGDLKVQGESGGGKIIVIMDGHHAVLSVKVDVSLMDETPEMMGDLFAAATNDAVRKVEKKSKEKISQLTKSLNIPTDFMKEEDKD